MKWIFVTLLIILSILSSCTKCTCPNKESNIVIDKGINFYTIETDSFIYIIDKVTGELSNILRK